MLLAIDPGVSTGWALFNGTVLTACGLGHPRHRALDVTQVIIEHPRIYPGGRTRDPNAIVKLAVNAGEWGGRYAHVGPVRYVEPRVWMRGNPPKGINHNRIRAELRADERDVLAAVLRALPESKHEHVLDAAGIGLFHLGRR